MRTTITYTNISAGSYLQAVSINKRTREFIEYSHEEFCNHQFENYEAFVSQDFQQYPGLIKKVKYSSMFRKFWNAEWLYRNKTEFLPFAETCSLSVKDLRGEYLFMHSTERLLNQPDFISRYEDLLKEIIPGQPTTSL